MLGSAGVEVCDEAPPPAGKRRNVAGDDEQEAIHELPREKKNSLLDK